MRATLLKGWILYHWDIKPRVDGAAAKQLASSESGDCDHRVYILEPEETAALEVEQADKKTDAL